MINRCECCGRELKEDKTKIWKEYHKRNEGVEFSGTIRRHYYSDCEDEEKICVRCYWILMIKKIIIRIISWGFAFFFIIGAFKSQGNEFITILTIASLLLGPYTLVRNRSLLYSIVGTILSPLLGPCEMHPFGNEYTIRERREDKVPISVERKLKKVEQFLMKKYHVNDTDISLILSFLNIRDEMEENYSKYKHMKTKKLALKLIPNEQELKVLYHKTIADLLQYQEKIGS